MLRIALVNNLPDAALRATERQFCTILRVASKGLTIQLDLYTLPGVARGPQAKAHLNAYYENLSDLERSRPDGIIVTGTEPHEARLQEEAFWPAFTHLFDYSRQTATPSIWCCLAAHAAVLYGNGISRNRLPAKLFGVFDSHVVAGAHDLLRGVPACWRMPQSRWHGLSEGDLVESGYEIGVRSRLTGPDVFFRHDPAPHVFIQAHPEYTASSLVAEYRRDIGRFLSGDSDEYPSLPQNLLAPEVLRHLHRFAGDAARSREILKIGKLDLILSRVTLQASWATAAHNLYGNWISQLSEAACGVSHVRGWRMPARDATSVYDHNAQAQAAD